MHRIVAGVIAGMACCLQGCVLGVGWLPDSSGFVYTSAKGDLLAYDLKAKKSRVVLKDEAARTTCWPAVSKDGKRVALAHLFGSEDKKDAFVQFVICDMQSKVVSRSEKLKLLPLEGKDVKYTTQVSWSPDEKKILVHCQGNANQGNSFDATAFFDQDSKKLEVWDQHVPAYFGQTPIRPDGAGFLLGRLKGNDDVEEYFWVDWSGKKQKLAMTKRDPGDEPYSPYPALLDSRWDGAKAVHTTLTRRVVVDTQKLQQTVEAIRKEDVTLGKELIRMRAMLSSGIELLLLEENDGSKDGPAIRLVTRKKGDAKVTEIIAPFRDRLAFLNPAPDGKHAILRLGYGYRGKQRDTIYVVNDAGRLQDAIAVIAEKE